MKKTAESSAINPFSGMKSRQRMDRWMGRLFLLFSGLPVILIMVMLAVISSRAWPVLNSFPLGELLTGQVWKPNSGFFGYAPFISGTLWVTLLAMVLAVPVSLLSAIYLSEYARPLTRSLIKPVLDILAGIPSVVYGVWGMVVVVPWIRESAVPFLNQHAGDALPFLNVNNPTGFSILAGGVVLAIMITPIIIAISYEVLGTVPAGLREASQALGATRLQTLRFVVFQKAFPGILAACMMAFSRAFGETMAVLMVVGNNAVMPQSIFDSAYPLTALIANNYGEMLSVPLYESALMMAALILMVIIVAVNILATLFLHGTLKRLAQ